MNIYIPYSLDRDVLKGVELKYALRSIEKYLTGWDDVCLIGDRLPSWYQGKSLYMKDYQAKKEISIYHKMKAAANVNESIEFLMWHDDHFLIKPLHVSEIKQWHNGSIQDECKRPHGGRYSKALHNTLDLFPDGLYYDIHTPCIFNKNNLQAVWDKEYCLKSFYFNCFPGEQEFMEDLKIDNYVSKEYIKTLIKDRLFFSTGCMHDPMVEVLSQLFPEPSKYER